MTIEASKYFLAKSSYKETPKTNDSRVKTTGDPDSTSGSPIGTFSKNFFP